MKKSYYVFGIFFFYTVAALAMKSSEVRIVFKGLDRDFQIDEIREEGIEVSTEQQWHMSLERLIGEKTHADLLQDHSVENLHQAFATLYSAEHPDLVACLNHKSRFLHESEGEHRGRHQRKDEYLPHVEYEPRYRQEYVTADSIDRLEVRLAAALLKVLSKNEQKKAEEAQAAAVKAEEDLKLTQQMSDSKARVYRKINVMVGILTAAAVGWAGKCQVSN